MNRTSLIVTAGAIAGSALLIALAACSSDTTPAEGGSGGGQGGTGGIAGSAGVGGSTGGHAGTGGTGGSTGGTGGSTGGTGGSTGGGAGEGGTGGGGEKVGQVMVGQTVMTISGTAYGSYYGSATFTDSTGQTSSDCTVSTVSECMVMACKAATPTDGGTTDGGTSKAPTAGDITVKGGTEDITLKADGTTGLYTAVTGTKALFTGGETLSYDAAGADVPAFSDSLTAPKTIALSAPALPTAPAKLDIDLASPPTFTWTNGDSKVVITLSDGDTTGTMHLAICSYDGSAGTATIPGDAIKDFSKGMSGASFSVASMTGKDVTAGDWKVTLQVTAAGNDANGAVTSGLANYK